MVPDSIGHLVTLGLKPDEARIYLDLLSSGPASPEQLASDTGRDAREVRAGFAVLADYGLASSISCQLKPHRRAGTIAYTAPEVHQGRLSNWTDQFSLAVMYCQLRTARLPAVMTPDNASRNITDATITSMSENARAFI